MHFSMLGSRMGLWVGILAFPLKQIQIPHPQDEMIGAHPGVS